MDLSSFVNLKLSIDKKLDEGSLEVLTSNIETTRNAIIATTAFARAKGIGGHTGGPYDIVPEALIVDSLREGGVAIHDEFFDEAGHRSAFQYVRGVLRGKMDSEKLLHYREYGSGLAGHPEPELLDCIDFSTGRLGHAAGHVNGVAFANPNEAIVMFGSDGSQMEGNNAEAARLAVANNLNVKWIIDDNNVTIAGNPENYMAGFDVGSTLEGHGFKVFVCEGENYSDLYDAMIIDEYPVCQIHSNMDKIDRHKSYLDFVNGKYRVLISSNITARGIDIQQVETVINFDIPKCSNTYLHRIGRSGRWGRKGTAINFITRRDYRLLKEIESFYSTQISELPKDYK